MAYAPTPKFTQQQDQPIVIQNRMPKAGDAEFTGTMPSLGGNNSTFRLVGTNQAGSTTPTTTSRTSTNPYPMGYTSGIPQGVDTVSGPGASYTPASSNTGNTNGNNNPNNPGTDKPSTGPRADWVNPNLSPGKTRQTQDWKGIYTAPANNPGTYDPNDIGRGIGWGYGYDPNTPSPGTTGKGPGGFTPRDGGGDMRTAATNYSMTSVGNSSGMPTYSSTARTGPADNRGGGGSPYLGPPGLGGGGQQPGGMTRPTDPSQFTPGQQARYGNMLGRIGYYHPGTGLSTAGTPYANPGYGNPAGIWGPGYQAPSWMGGGYRGGTWDPNTSPTGGGARPPGGGPPPWAPGTPKGGGGNEPPTRDPVMAGGGDYLRDIRNMDSGSGPTGGSNSGGGGGGGWLTVGMAPGMSSSRIASNDPRFANRTGVPAVWPNALNEIPTRGYQSPPNPSPGGVQYGTGGMGSGAADGGSPYLGPPQGGPPPGGIPPYPTIDWQNPPSPEQLLQMVNDWWRAWQAANPGGGPGPRFPGMVPNGATGVSSPYAPGAWGRMQEWWPRGGGGHQDTGGGGQDKNPGDHGGQDPNPGYTPPTYPPVDPRPPWGGDPGGGGNPSWPGPTGGGPWTSPMMSGGFGYDYLRSQRPGSGPGR